MVYAGGVGSHAGLARMREYGIGRLVTTLNWRRPIEDIPYIVDNAAFGAYLQGKPFPEEAFWKCLFDEEWCGPGKIERDSYAVRQPDFMVVPDIVAGGKKSLWFSLDWRQGLEAWPYSWYLVVQNGMTRKDVEKGLDLAIELESPFHGLFVGGTREWKFATTQDTWVRLARERELPIHVGGIGTIRRLVWAERIGVNSVDSTSFGRHNAYDRVPLAREQSLLTDHHRLFPSQPKTPSRRQRVPPRSGPRRPHPQREDILPRSPKRVECP